MYFLCFFATLFEPLGIKGCLLRGILVFCDEKEGHYMEMTERNLAIIPLSQQAKRNLTNQKVI